MTPLTVGAAPDLVIRKDEIGATAVPGGRIDYVLEDYERRQPGRDRGGD